MGGDGGSIPTRYELVKLKKKPEQKDGDSTRLFRWAMCALSQQPLEARGVVACEMGRLYSKEAVIQLLLSKDRSSAPPWAAHLERLKDVVELELTPNPAYGRRRQDAVGDMPGGGDKLVSMFMCPVTGVEMNGRFRFVFSWSSGKVVSERALKVLQRDPAEAAKFQPEDVIILNPTDEEGDELRTKMEARRAASKAARKAAKAAKKSSTAADDAGFKKPDLPGGLTSDQSLTDEPLPKKMKTKEFKDEGRKGKKSKKEPEESEGEKKVFNPFAQLAAKEKAEDALPRREGPRVKRADCQASELKAVHSYNLQDSGKSEVFKKLFTTHKSAQNLPKGNWVTFDPRYN